MTESWDSRRGLCIAYTPTVEHPSFFFRCLGAHFFSALIGAALALSIPALAQAQSAGNSAIRLTAVEATVAVGEKIVVRFSGMPGNATDWITLVPATAPATQYAQWFYLGGRHDGTVEFTGMPLGNYEVRAYLSWPDGGYNILARLPIRVELAPERDSEPFTILQDTVFLGQDVSIELTPRSDGTSDWVTLVPAEAAYSTFRQWAFRGNGHVVQFRTDAIGDYEVRLFHDWPRGGYTVVQRQRVQVLARTTTPGETVQPTPTADAMRRYQEQYSEGRFLDEGDPPRWLAGQCVDWAVRLFNIASATPVSGPFGVAARIPEVATRQGFTTVTDPRRPSIGAMIVWNDGGAGHVGVVTGIELAATGLVVGITVSESNFGPITEAGANAWGIEFAVARREYITEEYGRFRERSFAIDDLDRGRYRFSGYVYPQD